MVRWVRRIGLSFLFVALGLVLTGWLMLRASLPQLDGEAYSPALAQPVMVERDSLGSVTLRADNRRDLTFALGYVHAQERFFEMDLMRRRAAGELAELFGAAALPVDRGARVHRMRARMQDALTSMPAEDREEVDVYRDGVNAGLDALAARPFAYLLTRTVPRPWSSEDSLLVVAAMAFTLNDAGNQRELELARMHAALPAAAFAFLTASGGDLDAPLLGEPLVWPKPPTAEQLDLRATVRSTLPRVAGQSIARHDHFPGSNGFVVSGTLAGGGALVANDMHLDLRVPNIWFRARLAYPDPLDPNTRIDVAGASLPGAPALVVGSNGRVAWGFTNSAIDTVDWVRVPRDPDDSTRYRTADGWASLVRHSEVIRVHGAADETLDIEDTQWGPILATDTDGTPLALAWTAQQPGAIDLKLQGMETARSVDEAIAVAQGSGIPPQNLLVGDSQGNIAWTLAGRIPKRIGGYNPALPSDWSQPGTGWQGWLDAADVPLVSNPAGQRLWSGNQRMVDRDALQMLGDGGYDLGARARQIRDDLRAREQFAPGDLLDIQLDDRAVFLQRWKDLLERELRSAPATESTAALRTALADWQGSAAIDSVAYRLVRDWRTQVMDEILDSFAAIVRHQFADFALPKLPQAEHAVWALLSQRPEHLLPPDHASWDALLLACAERVVGKLAAQPGGLAARTWGERNTARIAHPLSRALPAFAARWLDMPAQPLPGDNNMPRVQSPNFGASERFAVMPGNEARGYFMMPGGQSGHPLSPFYGAGHEDWAQGIPTPFLPGAVEHTLTLRPVSRSR